MARKVLIVEDESNIAELINLYLKKEGYETMIAPDGGKALELYRLFRPDLVLLDIMLPVMDGWAVCSKIRETGQDAHHHADGQGRDDRQGRRAWRWARMTISSSPSR